MNEQTLQPITITVDPTKDIIAIQSEAGKAKTLAEAYEIDGPETYEMAGKDLQQIKARLKAVDEQRKSITRPLDEAKKAIMALFDAPTRFLQGAEGLLKQKMLAFSEEQERKQRELRAKLEEEARKERERLAAEAAAARAKAEEEARKLREQAEAAKAAGDAAKAAKLESRAESRMEAADEKASTLEHQAAVTVAPAVQIQQAEVKGVSTREEWDFEYTDQSLLPREFLIPDEKAIRAVVKARKGATNIPGIRVFSKRVLAARAG